MTFQYRKGDLIGSQKFRFLKYALNSLRKVYGSFGFSSFVELWQSFCSIGVASITYVQVGGITNTTIISLVFYHSECPKNLFHVHTANMFPQSTSFFTSAVTKLTKKCFRLQINKFIMVVENVDQFATVLTLFRCFLPNAHCSHDCTTGRATIVT